MKKLLCFALSLAFLLSSSSAFALTHKQKREFRKAVRVVAMDEILMKGYVASAVPISKSKFITAGHFCKDAAELSEFAEITIDYLNANNEIATLNKVRIEKFELSDELDLCILSRPKHGIVPVKITKNYNKLSFGDRVYVVGSPKGVFPVITEGYVSVPRIEGDETPIVNGKMLFSAAITNGNSGGPVYNVKGELIGIAVMGHSQYEHLNFAVTALDVLEYLK